MEKSERKRAANFTSREKEILISLVEKYFKILENKKTNSVFNKQKSDCWEKLAQEYNSVQTTGLRTGSQLKATYEKIKQIAKQHKSEEKVEVLKTGGGTFVTKVTDLDEKVLILLKSNYFSIDNSFDSDAKNVSLLGEKSNFSQRYTSDNQCSNVENIIYELYEDDRADSGTNSVMQIFPSFITNIDANRNSTITKEPCTYDQVLQCQETKQNEIFCYPSVEMTPKADKIEPITPYKDRGIKRKFKVKDTEMQTLINKKIARVEKKINILDIIKDAEIENLKSKKIDNEVKEIVKEREMLQLKIKQKEYENMLLQ